MAKRKTLDADGIWRPKKVKIVYTDEKLSAGSGLGPFIDAFVESPQSEALKRCLPKRSSNASYDPLQFVLPLMGGFWHGYDCLEDLEKLEDKADIVHQMEGLPSARAVGDYLRDFTGEHHGQMNEFLVRQSLAARKLLSPGTPLVRGPRSTGFLSI